MFDIVSSRDFLAKLWADCADFKTQTNSARHALNCIITAYHLRDWVWGDWLSIDYATWKKLGIRDLYSFTEWLECEWPDLGLVQSLANGAKHFNRNTMNETELVTGYGMGPYGVGPYSQPYLLIDRGAGDGLERWTTAEDLIEGAFAIWTRFFQTYRPELSSPPTHKRLLNVRPAQGSQPGGAADDLDREKAGSGSRLVNLEKLTKAQEAANAAMEAARLTAEKVAEAVSVTAGPERRGVMRGNREQIMLTLSSGPHSRHVGLAKIKSSAQLLRRGPQVSYEVMLRLRVVSGAQHTPPLFTRLAVEAFLISRAGSVHPSGCPPRFLCAIDRAAWNCVARVFGARNPNITMTTAPAPARMRLTRSSV